MSAQHERLPMPDGWPDPLVDEKRWPRGPCSGCGSETAVRADAGVRARIEGEAQFLCEDCISEVDEG